MGQKSAGPDRSRDSLASDCRSNTCSPAFSGAIRLALLPIMFVGAIPLPVYYLLLKGKLEGFATDRQTRWLLFVTAL